MAHLAYPARLHAAPGYVARRQAATFSGAALTKLPGRLLRDFRLLITTSGTITDQVVIKTGPATEVPFSNARVWLLRAADGYKAWEGWSNATGHYTATGLEIGVEYVAVAIDPTRNHKTTAAGPVASA